jgi:WD40 repeat protein/predicted chitinase/energy-coupling factor transporter ATP-binding protein EcfA2
MIEQEQLLSNPFPGLRPFEMDENFLFFGRDGQSEEVLNRLRASRFVAVVGTSGSGKSSLVRAGLLPALYSGHMTSAGSSWRIAIFRPGNNPIGNLAQALDAPDVFGVAETGNADLRLTNTETTLRRSSLGLIEIVSQARMAPQENLLIVADQFEELFRFKRTSTSDHPEDEAAAFVRLLLESTRQRELPIYIILTMRSDFLGEAAQFWGLPEAINEGQYLIPRMTDDGRREAVTGPIAIGGAEITLPLVNRLLNDAGDNPDQLPILQHALMRTWDYWKGHARESDPIDISHYEKIGGMSKALSLHADEAYEELSDPLQPEGSTLQRVAEKLFKSLTERGQDNREVRRPTTVREICEVAQASAAEVTTVIESFRREGRSFLMPPPVVPLTADTLIDISHESLIRGWQRLKEWVNQEAQSARTYKRLAETAVLHEKKEAGLWRDPDLELALKWREKSKPNEAWAERYHSDFDRAMTFLDASLANREREAAEREQQIEHDLKQAQALAIEQQRRVKQQRWGIGVLSLLLLLLTGLTVYAFNQKGKAQEATIEADMQRKEAFTQRDTANAALVAQQEAETQRNEAKQATAATQQRLIETQKESVKRAQADAIKQQQIAQRALKAEGEAKKQSARAVAALSDAKTQRDNFEKEKNRAEGALNDLNEKVETIKEIDRSAPYFKAIMRGHKNVVTSAAYSPDGRKVLTIDIDNSARVWDADTGDLKLAIGGQEKDKDGSVNTVMTRFSPDGKRIGVLNDIRGGSVVDAETGKTLLTLGSRVFPLSFTPDSKFILTKITAAKGGAIYLLDAQTGKIVREFGGREFIPIFSPDSKYMLTLADDNTVQILGTSTLQKLSTLNGHTEQINSFAFSHDGKRIVTASNDDTARIWDVQTGENLITLIGHTDDVKSAVFSSNDQYVVTASKDGTARVWNAVKGATLVINKGSSSERTEVRGITIAELKGHAGEVRKAIFSPDDKWVVTISADKTARVWQATTEERGIKPGEVLAILSGHIGALTSVDFSRDFSNKGKFVVTASEDRTARVWDLTGLNNLQGISANLDAKTSDYRGACPATLKFDGRIWVAEGSGKVRYKFIYSDGRPGELEELTFDSPGSKEVSTTLTLARSSAQAAGSKGATPTGTAGEWVAIQILEPAGITSNHANFTVTCQNEAQNLSSVGRVTDQVLAQIMPNLPADKRVQYLPYLQQAMAEFDINTPARQAAFLAQVAHESAELRYLTELGAGEAYEGRKDLGNTQPGDGKRFKGRGVIEIVGRANYQSFGQLLGIDLINHPELAATPEVAFRLAGLFWKSRGLNEFADQQTDAAFASITRRINGGINGLAERQKYYDRAKSLLGVVSIDVQPKK